MTTILLILACITAVTVPMYKAVELCFEEEGVIFSTIVIVGMFYILFNFFV